MTMKYVMLICDDPSNFADLTEQEQKRAYDEIFAHVDKWEKLGRYVDGGKELQSPQTARTIRRDGSGGTVVTDGPYTEIKELIGGFMVIEPTRSSRRSRPRPSGRRSRWARASRSAPPSHTDLVSRIKLAQVISVRLRQ
jgi:hypothetical protein